MSSENNFDTSIKDGEENNCLQDEEGLEGKDKLPDEKEDEADLDENSSKNIDIGGAEIIQNYKPGNESTMNLPQPLPSDAKSAGLPLYDSLNNNKYQNCTEMIDGSKSTTDSITYPINDPCSEPSKFENDSQNRFNYENMTVTDELSESSSSIDKSSSKENDRYKEPENDRYKEPNIDPINSARSEIIAQNNSDVHNSSFIKDDNNENIKCSPHSGISNENLEDISNRLGNNNSNPCSSNSRPSSVYDFHPNNSENDLPLGNYNNSMIFPMHQPQPHQIQPNFHNYNHHNQQQSNRIDEEQDMNKEIYQSTNCIERPETNNTHEDKDIFSHIGPMNPLQQSQPLDFHPNNPINNMPNNTSGGCHPYNNQMAIQSPPPEYPNTANCYDPVIMRRARGRPRGSKNGTGMGRGNMPFMRENYRYHNYENQNQMNNESKHDPFGTARRGRPRSRFIVDLGEQNHEAWTKARINLNVTDAELTTLLLSL